MRHLPLLALLLAAGCDRPPPTVPTPTAPSVTTKDDALPPGAKEAAAVIDEQGLRRDVAALSADGMHGRGPGTEGDRMARTWLIEALGSVGLHGGMAGGRWEQPFDVVGVTATMPQTLLFRGKEGAEVGFSWGQDYMGASGVQQSHVEIRDAEVVFVGYGIVAPEMQWDDFAGVDLTGKVLLMLNDDPSGDPSLFGGERRLYYGRWTYKYESAARQGAAGAFIIHTDSSAGYPWQVVKTSWSGEQVELPDAGEPRLPLKGWLTEQAARQLAALASADLDDLVSRAQRREFEPIPLGITTSHAFDCALRKTTTANVVGVLDGGDRASEAVILSAHHDHLGEGEPAGDGDRIYNGARDNAAGVAQALAVARAFAALPESPRRSVMVAFVGAEEQGLLGSRYLAEHPPIPTEQIVANVNFELGNLWGRTHDVIVHGKGKSTVDAVLESMAARQGRVLRDEADPRSGWYYRSDQLSFARVGIPSIWFESGRDYLDRPAGWGDEQVRGWVASRYHQPSDELSADWRFDGMVEDARLAFTLALTLASSDSVPSWSPGDEFEALRPAAPR